MICPKRLSPIGLKVDQHRLPPRLIRDRLTRLVKQYTDRIEISNPGGLVGDLTPENILHHPPAARNRCLVDALGRLRLINRMNLGMERIYSSLLMEGKPPPDIEDVEMR